MKSKTLVVIISLASVSALALLPAAVADVTSPSIKNRGKKYTKEKANSAYYGSGQSGRLVEASELRFKAHDLLDEGEWAKAIPVARKAVQLDPGDPSGHLDLARALTMKLYQTKGEIDEKLLTECMQEWQLIRYHDADPTEQWEAGMEYKKLSRIAKALMKQKKLHEKERAQARIARKEKSAEDDDASSSPSTRVKLTEKRAPVESKASDTGADDDKASGSGKQLAEKKKRFGIF